MTETTAPLERSSERGSALIAVLLLLMMMTALAAAISIGSQTESLVARNENAGAEAQAAAEAGLNHAVELAINYIFEWKTNGFGSVNEAVNSLLAGPDGATGTPDDDEDNFSLGARVGITAAEDIPLEVTAADRLTLGTSAQARYTAIVLDDDASAPAIGGYIEDGDLANDLNRRLVIRATGYVMGVDGNEFSKVTLEATIGPVEMGAIVTEGDLTISGSVEINGPSPSDKAVHTNSDLTIEGSGGSITGLVTATGEVDNDNDDIVATGGSPAVDIPPVAASDWEVWADFKLRSDGTMLNVSTGGVCTWSKKTSCNGWDFDSSTGGWSNNGTPTNGTYYVQGDVTMTGSPGTAKAPLQVSLIAEGNIQISGSPKLKPDTPELLFVTNKDLKITGTFDEIYTEDTLLQIQGQVLVHEQLELGGNVTLAGQLIVEDAANTSSLVTANHIHGNVQIDYGGGLGSNTYSVLGWRDVRDAD